MDKKVFYRYALKDGLPVKEETIFIKANPEGPLPHLGDPRLVPLEGEDGLWVWAQSSNQFATQAANDKMSMKLPVNPLLEEILVEYTLISEEEYLATMAAIAAANEVKKQEKKAEMDAIIAERRAQKEAILKRLGITDEELHFFIN